MPDRTPEPDHLILRTTTRQRFTALAGVLAWAALVCVMLLTGPTPTLWGEWLGTGLLGLAGVGPLAVYVIWALGYTACDTTGLRGRWLGRGRRVAWADVVSVRVQTYGRRARSRVVMATTRDGKELRLAAPVDGAVLPDPGFDAKFERIRAYRSAHLPSRPRRPYRRYWPA